LFADFDRHAGLLVRRPCPHALAQDLLDVVDHRVLVRRTVATLRTDLIVDVRQEAQPVLDDRFFQSARVPDGDETGSVQSPQGLDAGQHSVGKRGHQLYRERRQETAFGNSRLFTVCCVCFVRLES